MNIKSNEKQPIKKIKTKYGVNIHVLAAILCLSSLQLTGCTTVTTTGFSNTQGFYPNRTVYRQFRFNDENHYRAMALPGNPPNYNNFQPGLTRY